MAENASNSIRNIKSELRLATEQAVSLNVQLAELNAPGSNATEQQIAAVNQQLVSTIERTAELKDAVNDANERINVLAAGSKFEQLGNSIGDVGGKILSLDFEGANESAGRLLALSKTITFGSAVSSVKDLGSTFLQLGKALLTNPLFLIAAVIIALVVAIGKALDKLGLLKKITEAVGAVFDWLFGLIESAVTAITDFFGLTSEAEREATKALAANAEQAEKNAVSQEKKTESVVQGIDNEIRIATLQGKNTEQLERKKVQLLRETARERYEADKAAYKAALAQNELTREEIADLKEKARVSKLAAQQASADAVFFEEKTKKAKSDAKDKDDKSDADSRKSNYEKAKAAQEAFDRERLQTARAIKDLELAALEDGVEKELAISEEKYRRLREDNLNNSKLTTAERTKLDALLLSASEAELSKIRKTNEDKKLKEKKEADDKLIAAQQAYYDKFDLLGLSELDKSVRQRQIQYDIDAEALDKALEDKIITQEEYNDKLRLLTKEVQDDIAKLEADAAKEALDKLKAEQAEKIKVITDGVNGIASAFKTLGTALGSALSTGIGNAFAGISSLIDISQTEFEDSAKGRAEQVSAYTQAIGGIISGFLSVAVEANKEALAEDLANIDEKYKAENDIIQTQLNNGTLTKEQADRKIKELDIKAAKEKDIIGKKSFEENKKLQIAQAVISGLTGAVAAFAGAMQLGQPQGAIVGGVLAAAVAGLTAFNVAKIKSTQYSSTASSGGGGGGGAPSLGSSSLVATTPQFNLFGQGNDANTVGPGAEGGSNNMNINVNSQVSVSEINDVQNKVAVQEDRATL